MTQTIANMALFYTHLILSKIGLLDGQSKIMSP